MTFLASYQGFPGASVVKNSPAVQEKWEMHVRPMDREDPPEKEMATHSNTLAWEIPWTVEPSGLQSMRPQRVRPNLVTKQQQQQLASHIACVPAVPWTQDVSLTPGTTHVVLYLT